jgi:creatinine amidohydrolase
MQLQMCTWPEVETYLKTSTGIIMPIGSTEQHGPIGHIGTDALCAEVVAMGAGDAAQVMVAPTIHVGMANHHMAFPGSMTLMPSTLIQVMKEYVLGLTRHGFRRFMFLNGHGGNISTINAAFPEILATAHQDNWVKPGELRLTLKNWFDGAQVKVLRKELYSDKEGWHATPSEIALMQHAFPEHIKSAELADIPPVTRAPMEPEAFRATFPDGRMGSHSGMANPKDGKDLFDLAVQDMAQSWQSFVQEP